MRGRSLPSERRRPLPCALLVLFALAAGGCGRGEESVGPGAVYVLTVEGTIAEGQPPYVARALREAAGAGARRVVVRIRSFGGLVAPAAAIKDALLASSVPTTAYVDRRAISAGALVALACDEIVMAPGATIGAATPYQIGAEGAPEVTEKMISALRAMFRSTAQAKGHPARIAEAMVDPDVAIEGVVARGKLLTLSTEEAVRVGLAAGTAPSLDALLAASGVDVPVRVVPVSPAERLANGLSSPVVASLLVSIGFLALLVALQMPGTGLAEAVAIACFAVFFGGKYVAGLAGAEELVLVLLGLVLLGVEIFAIPGAGVAGIAGVLCILAGLGLSFLGPLDGGPLLAEQLGRAARALGLSLVVLAAGLVGIALAVRRSEWWQRLAEAPDAGRPPGVPAPPEALRLVGRTGTVVAPLAPTGDIVVDGERLTAIAENEPLAAGTPVRIVRMDGWRAVVAREGAAR